MEPIGESFRDQMGADLPLFDKALEVHRKLLADQHLIDLQND